METLAYERGCSVVSSTGENLVFVSTGPWAARREVVRRRASHLDALCAAQVRGGGQAVRGRDRGALEASAGIAAECPEWKECLDGLNLILS